MQPLLRPRSTLPLLVACAALWVASPELRSQVRWRNQALNAPTAGSECGMAYDGARDRMVLFGGGTAVNSGWTDETWEFDGTVWKPRETAVRPPARMKPRMVWDSGRNRVVLFGGYTYNGGYTYFGDTWEWDGQAWSNRSTAGPLPRHGHSMVYDARRQRVVLFGGVYRSGSIGVLNDTWEWDGITWTERHPPIRPPARTYGAMVYDPVRGVTILQGGSVPNATGGDTWEWDGTQWIERVGPGGGPTLSGHGGFFDAVRGRVMILGESATLAVQYEWTGTTWNLVPAAPLPPGENQAIAYDTLRQRAIVYGGETFNYFAPPNRFTWQWDGVAWSLAAGGPEGRQHHTMTWDSARKRLVLIGGSNSSSFVVWRFEQVWEWDGSRWFGPWDIPSSFASGGPGIAEQASAYDPVRGHTLVFGGINGFSFDDETWSWDGATWTQHFPTRVPPGRKNHGMVWVGARDRILMFGGEIVSSALFDTWVWDGSDWTALQPMSAPAARSHHGMAYDESRDRVVLFGGLDGLGQELSDTWEWDGQTWTQLAPLAAPRARFGHAMQYDPDRQRVVLVGGERDGGATLLNDTWEWDGTQWIERTPTGRPERSSNATLTYDPLGRVLVLTGGRTSASAFRETFGFYHPTQPAEYLRFGSACTGTAGTPLLTTASHEWPWIGSPFSVEVRSLPAGAPVAFAFGASTSTWGALTLPFTLPGTGSPGCDVSISLDVIVPLTAVGGTATMSLSLPATPALVGRDYYNQALVVDPGANTLGITTSNAAAARIGAK